jgi:radical SAM superfamily enzyme YgiQ (UPF0313 family)
MIAPARPRPFRLTIVHPCVGRFVGMKRYIRTWRMEPIPFDRPTDLVAISVETYTAKRAYQIASAYRQRGVPVVMGGFHATLCPEEVSQFCESIVLGEAEAVFPQVVDDYRHGRPQRVYRASERPSLTVAPDRSIFRGKRYLPIHLVEFARGCRFKCDFCAIQSFFQSTHNHRPIEDVVREIQQVRRPGQMFFFIDDNITSSLSHAKELMRALVPLRIRWVSQSAINVAYDGEALELMRRSGCQGMLVGFESLEPANLQQMNKEFNLMHGGPRAALANFRRHGIRIYGTFIFGYDHDTAETFRSTVAFAREQKLAIAAFNHITPFPGTPLYARMKAEGRLLFDAWWLDDRYRYNMIPYRPKNMSPEDLAEACVEARRNFYSWPSILYRATQGMNWRSPWMMLNFLVINAMHQRDVEGRNGLPLGDEGFRGKLIRARHAAALPMGELVGGPP